MNYICNYYSIECKNEGVGIKDLENTLSLAFMFKGRPNPHVRIFKYHDKKCFGRELTAIIKSEPLAVLVELFKWKGNEQIR